MAKYAFGDFELNLDTMQLTLRGVPVHLERRPLDLLALLIRRDGHLVTRDELIGELWPPNVIIDFDSGLNTLVRKVRNALGDASDHPRFIETVPGRGYRFIAAVTPVTEPVPGARQSVELPRPSSRLARTALVLAVVAGVVVLSWQVRSVDSPQSITSASVDEIPGVALADPVVRLAVLPFKPLTPTDSNESLELGMAETLIDGLNGSGRIRVSPLSSVRRYTGNGQDAVAAGRALGVRAVLEGYLQRAGDRLRISARLLDTEDGRQLWTERYDEEFTDIFSVQDAIAARVRAALMPDLIQQLDAELPHDTHDAEAYQLFANGRFYVRRNVAGMRRAIGYFEEAIARDPGFARAYVGLGEAYSLLGVFGAVPPHEAFPQARAAIDKALELDPNLGEAYASLGHVKAQYELDWTGAERALLRAIELSPSFAPAQQWYGHYLAYVGRIEEGLAQIRKAQALEPAAPSYGALIGMFLNYERRYDEAIVQLNKTLETDADLDIAHAFIAVSYTYSGDYERALEHLSRTTSVTPGSGGSLGQVYAASGRRAEALAEIDRLMAVSTEHNVAAHDIASIYAALGETDHAFLWLDRALEDRSQLLGWIRWNPAFDPIRKDPRYADFMQRLGLGQ